AGARRPDAGRRGCSAGRGRPRRWTRHRSPPSASATPARATARRPVRRPWPGTGPAERSAVSAAGDRASPPAPRFAPAQGPVVLRSPALLTRRASGVGANSVEHDRLVGHRTLEGPGAAMQTLLTTASG